METERKFLQPRVLFSLVTTVDKWSWAHLDEGRGEILSNECCSPPWTRVAPRMSSPGTEIRRRLQLQRGAIWLLLCKANKLSKD